MSKILIIDDERALLENFADFFRFRGYDVFIAENGKKGLELLRKEAPEALLLDLHLNEEPQGLDVLRMAKVISPGLRVIVLSGFGEDNDLRDKCAALGADIFLVKPSPLKQIMDAVKGIKYKKDGHEKKDLNSR